MLRFFAFCVQCPKGLKQEVSEGAFNHQCNDAPREKSAASWRSCAHLSNGAARVTLGGWDALTMSATSPIGGTNREHSSTKLFKRLRMPVKRHRGEPGHTRDTRDTRTHKGTQTNLTTNRTHQQTRYRYRGEPGHARDTRTHKGTRTAQTNLTTIQTHQQHTPRTSARRPKPRPTPRYLWSCGVLPRWQIYVNIVREFT